MKSLLLLALGLARTVVLGARIEAERIVVSVRPYKREQRRCPVCGRACDFYDMANRGAPRLWRAMDLARSACYLEYAPCRVRCPEHGVRTEAVPLGAARGALHARLRGLGGVAGGPLHRLGGLRARPRRVAQRGRRVQARLRRAGGRARRLEVRRRAPHRHRRDVVQEGPQVRHGGRRPRPRVSVNLFFTSFAKQARRSRKGGFTGCANVFSPIPVTA